MATAPTTPRPKADEYDPGFHQSAADKPIEERWPPGTPPAEPKTSLEGGEVEPAEVEHHSTRQKR